MRTSEQINELAKALAAAQAEFPAVPKTKQGTIRGEGKGGKEFSYTYAYADIADVLLAVLPITGKHGLSVIQPTIYEGTLIVVVTRLMHESGQWIESDYPVCKAEGDHKKMGAALTYARRYALCSLIGVAPDEDADGDGAEEVKPPAGRQRASRAKASSEPDRGEPDLGEPFRGEETGPLEDPELVDPLGKRRQQMADPGTARVTSGTRVTEDTPFDEPSKEREKPPREDAESTQAIKYGRVIKGIQTEEDLDDYLRLPSFQSWWKTATGVDRKYVGNVGEARRKLLRDTPSMAGG